MTPPPDLDTRLREKLRELFGADARSLAALRVGLAAILLGDLAHRALELRAHYTDLGVLPRAALRELLDPWSFSLHALSGSTGWVALLFVVAGAAAVALGLGWRTRIATVVSWVLLVSLQNRNPPLYHAGDTLLRLVLFWCMFLPLGRVWSLDARRGREGGPLRVVCVGTVGLLVQLLSVYVFLIDQKLSGLDWTAGTAVGWALSVEQYRAPMGTFLAERSSLLGPLTHATMITQALVPLAFLVPVFVGPARTAGVALVLATQLGFGLCFTLGIFPWIGAASMIALLPAWLWERLPWPRPAPATSRPAPRLARIAVGIFGAFCILVTGLWNVGESGVVLTLRESGRRIDGTLFWEFVQLFRLDQRWAMFAPNPQREDGWFVLESQMRDGTTADLFQELVGAGARREVSWEKPPLISATFGHHRWAMFLLPLMGRPPRAQLEGLAQHVCRRGDVLEARLHLMHFEHLAGGHSSPVEKRLLHTARCRLDSFPQ